MYCIAATQQALLILLAIYTDFSLFTFVCMRYGDDNLLLVVARFSLGSCIDTVASSNTLVTIHRS